MCFITPPAFIKQGAYFFIVILTKIGYDKNIHSLITKYMYCEASYMNDICANCNRLTYCLEPCEQWLIHHDKCPVFQNKLIRSGGCTECITGDWARCG